MNSFRYLIFAALTIVSWGVYGPLLHAGQEALGDGVHLSRWKPFILVGVAYFLIAVIYPLIMIPRENRGNWSITGVFWSFVAGAAGALGALGIILAFVFGGSPVFVMPLVFGFAPVVNTLVNAVMSRSMARASVLFYLGVVVVAVGGAGVMYFKPSHAPAHATPEPATSAGEGSAATSSETPATSDTETPARSANRLGLVLASIALTALSWGSYGPMLHKGQSRMGGSRLRPFLFVGLAYLVIAVILPLVLWRWLPPDPGEYNTTGVAWSLLGGAVGAAGALGIIYAFNFGGKPITIMPLVFGGAPVINTLITTATDQSLGRLTPLFYASLFLVIAGAVAVLVFAPRENRAAAGSGGGSRGH
jgi:hypothetical protein